MIQDTIMETLQNKELVLKSNVQLIWVILWGVTMLIWAIINLEKIKNIRISNEIKREELRKLKLENDAKDDI